MSSETSTESPPVTDGKTADPLQPWQLFTLAGLMGATLVVSLSQGQSPAGVIVLSLTIFAAAVVGAAALRALSPFTSLFVSSATRIVGGRTLATLERDKGLALRAIKELEFDRAMGKVSEQDFLEVGGRLRARAARLIRQIDADAGYRTLIDREVARRLGTSPAVQPVPRVPSGAVRSPAVLVDADAPVEGVERVEGVGAGVARAATAGGCRSCGAEPDADARFCKHCGARVGVVA